MNGSEPNTWFSRHLLETQVGFRTYCPLMADLRSMSIQMNNFKTSAARCTLPPDLFSVTASVHSHGPVHSRAACAERQATLAG